VGKRKRQEHRGDPGRTSDRVAPYALLVAIATALWLGIFLFRLLGPPNLLANDQEKTAAYVLDAYANGNWIIQQDAVGNVSSKPPMMTWLMALTAVASGGVDDFSLYLAPGLCVLAVTWMILAVGWFARNQTAGFLGAMAYLLSTAAFKQVHLARTDPLFSVFVFGGALLVWRAATGRGSWNWFWLVAALATLTKGPLGLLIPLLGLPGLMLAPREHDVSDELTIDGVRREKRRRTIQRTIRSLVPGLAIFLGIVGLWALLALAVEGRALIQKMIGDELVGHALESGGGKRPFQNAHIPILYFASRFMPWSLLAFWGIGTLVVRARGGDSTIPFFLASYLVLGLALFSIFPHHRWEHQYPLLPAAALLAGWQLSAIFSARDTRRLAFLLPAVGAVVVAGGIAFQHFLPPQRVKESIISREAAAYIRESLGSEFPVMHVDSTMGTQFYLGTMRQRVSRDQARAALRSPRAAYVLVRGEESLAFLQADAGIHPIHEIKRWTVPGEEEAFLRLVSNRNSPDRSARVVFYDQGLRVEADGLDVARLTRHALRFTRRVAGSSLRIVNETGSPAAARLEITGLGDPVSENVTLAPGAEFRLP